MCASISGDRTVTYRSPLRLTRPGGTNDQSARATDTSTHRSSPASTVVSTPSTTRRTSPASGMFDCAWNTARVPDTSRQYVCPAVSTLALPTNVPVAGSRGTGVSVPPPTSAHEHSALPATLPATTGNTRAVAVPPDVRYALAVRGGPVTVAVKYCRTATLALSASESMTGSGPTSIGSASVAGRSTLTKTSLSCGSVLVQPGTVRKYSTPEPGSIMTLTFARKVVSAVVIGLARPNMGRMPDLPAKTVNARVHVRRTRLDVSEGTDRLSIDRVSSAVLDTGTQSVSDWSCVGASRASWSATMNCGRL